MPKTQLKLASNVSLAASLSASKHDKEKDRQTLLDKISDILFTSFEDNHTIKKIAQLIISDIADYCRIVTLDENNSISDISVNHTDPKKVQLITDLYYEYKDDIATTQGVHKILQTGKAELLPIIDEKIFESIKYNPKLVKIIKDIGLKSYMGIPLIVHGKIIGAITFSSVRPSRVYGEDDLTFVKEIGRRIALALDNARLYRAAENARREAENERQRLHDLFMQAPAMIAINRGPNHIYELANPLYLNVVGKTKAIIGKPVAEVFPEIIEQGIMQILDNVYQTGKPFYGGEHKILLDVKNTGKPVECYFNFVYQPSRDANGKVDGILVHAIDVTNMVADRQKIEKSEKYFRALIEHSADAIAMTDVGGTVVYASPNVKKILGYTAEEMMGKHGSIFIHPNDLEITQLKLSGIMKKIGKALTVEHRAIHKNGSIKWMETTATNLIDEPSVGAVVTNFRDITERKQAEGILRDTRNQLKSALAAGTIATWIWDIHANRVIGDKNMAHFFGVKLAQVTEGLPSKAFIDAVHPDDRSDIKKYVTKVLETGENYKAEYRLISKSGTIRWVMARGKIEYNSEGKAVRFSGVLVDITDRKKAEEKLRESEETARAVFDQAAIAMSITTVDGKWIDFNKVYPKMFGYTRTQLKKMTFTQITHPDDQAQDKASIARLLSGELKEYTREKRYIHKNGSIVYATIHATVVRDHIGLPQYIITVLQDMTKRKQTEVALRESEERLRFMAESMPQKLFTADPKGNIDYFNPQWMEYAGMAFEHIKDWGWLQLIHPDDVDKNVRSWQHSINTGEPLELEHRFRRYDGEYRWHISRAQAMRDETGKIIRWFGSNTDVDDMRRTTTRKNELEKITVALTAQRAQLVVLNKAKDEFISLASHQLRTPATGVKQYVGMLLEGYAGKLTAQQKAFLKQAYESNERQINIVNDLLRVAKVDAGKVTLDRQKTDLVSLLENVLHEQASKFSERHQTIIFTPPKRSLMAEVDPDRMRMVIENVIDNASKYTLPDRKITVTISKNREDVLVAVKDEGVGVSKSDLKKIFNKFSRIDNSLSIKVGGTGLGLYWAKKIMDLHGGTIEVESELGKGSVFTVKIPAS